MIIARTKIEKKIGEDSGSLVMLRGGDECLSVCLGVLAQTFGVKPEFCGCAVVAHSVGKRQALKETLALLLQDLLLDGSFCFSSKTACLR